MVQNRLNEGGQGSKICIESKLFVLLGCHHAGLLVLSHSSLEEVCLSLERNHLHPVEGVLAIPDLGHSEGKQEAVGHTFDVLDHQLNKKRLTLLLMPIRSLGRLSEMNLFSIQTACWMISWMSSGLSLFFICEQRWQAKSVWSPSSLEMSSLEKVSPGINDLFLSQKMAQNDPEKKIPSTAAKATNLSWKVLSLFIQFMAHCAFSRMTSMLVMALKRQFFSFESLMQVSMRREQVSECTFSMAIWKPQKHLAYGICTSEQNCWARFSRTIPSDAAKKASTFLMKCFSFSFSFCQSFRSWQRSISSAVQNEARCFLYISKMEWYWMGKRTNLWSFSLRMGSYTSGAENGLAALMFKQQIIIFSVNFEMGFTGLFQLINIFLYRSLPLLLDNNAPSQVVRMLLSIITWNGTIKSVLRWGCD